MTSIISIIESNVPEEASWYDLIEIKSESTPISFKNNRIHSIFEKENHGFGIRINIKGRTGFSYTNDESKIKNAVKRAVDMSPYCEIESFTLPSSAVKVFEPYDESISSFDPDEEIQKGSKAIGSILKKFPGANIDLRINMSAGRMRIINSRGVDASYRSSYYSVSLSATVISDKGTKLDIWESRSSLYPVKYEDLADMLIEKIGIASVEKNTGSGKIPVIFSPKAAAGLIRIAAGGLNGRSVWKGISFFAGKKGEQVFNKEFTLYDDPLLRDSPFSYPFDDEGTPGKDKVLIENGAVKNFIADLKYAEKLEIEPGGNGARGYASPPSTSFSNVVVKPGSTCCSDMIKDMRRGILVEQFIGLGQSNTLTGDFSANLDLAYLIENGSITGRVKDCMIWGNLFDLLKGDVTLSSEWERRGSLYTPYIFFPSIDYMA